MTAPRAADREGGAPPAVSFRCSVACEQRGESIAGTASTVGSYLLVEHPGPWGDVALRDARLPGDLGPRLRTRSRAAGVRVLFIRRPAGGSRDAAGVRVFAGRSRQVGSWLETARLDRIEDVLDLDLETLGAGRSPGLTPHAEPLIAVCTHGRHDACCAERGRPVAAALAGSHGDLVWEVSHMGGDRFAANLLAMPWGLYLGRVDPDTAPGLVDGLLRGEVDVEFLRGRSALAMPLQTAEIALRRQLGASGVEAVRCTSRSVADGVTDAVFEVDGELGAGAWSVRVRSSLDDRTALLTCRAERAGWAAVHEVLDVRALEHRAS